MSKPKDKLNPQKMAAEYGFALAFLNSDPEIKSLFQNAVKHTWTPDMFVARLRGTKWFKTHSASVRNAIMMQTSDPTTYKAKVDEMYAHVADTYGKTYGSGGDPAQMRKWAETAFRMGWSDDELLAQMGKSIDFGKLLTSQSLGGTAAEARAQINEFTGQYGVDPGNTWLANNVKNVTQGTDTIGGIQDRVRQMAAQQYSAFADQINAGHTVAEIADPYVQKMSDLLELDPSSISLKDTTIQNALTKKNDQGVPTGQSLSDFANAVRQDSRWQYTDNAKTQVAEVGSQLLRSFGLTN